MSDVAFDLRGEHGPLRDLVRDVWRSRPLLRILSRKEFLVRYRRASFGVLWALALPLLQAGVFSLIVPRIVRFDVEGSYLVFFFSGTTVWTFFSGTLSDGTSSLVNAQDITTRVYFPRLVIPLTTVLANLYAFLPGVLVLAAMAAIVEGPRIELLWLVPGMALVAMFVASLTALLSAVNVYFRDVKYLVAAALLVWMYLTPIFYPLDVIGDYARWIELNPVTGAVQLFRNATLETPGSVLRPVCFTLGWTVVLLVAALAVHRRRDRVFVDLL